MKTFYSYCINGNSSTFGFKTIGAAFDDFFNSGGSMDDELEVYSYEAAHEDIDVCTRTLLIPEADIRDFFAKLKKERDKLIKQLVAKHGKAKKSK